MSFSFIGLTPEQVAALPTCLFATLGAAEFAELDEAQAGALSSAQINAIQPLAFSGLGAAAMSGLSAAALQGISTTAAAAFSAAQISEITPVAFSAMSTCSFTALTRDEISGITALQMLALDACQVAAIAPAAIRGLSALALGVMSATQAAALTAAQIRHLSGQQLDALSAAALNAAPLANLSMAQIAGLTSAAIGRFSVAKFDCALAPGAGWFSASQAPGLTLDQIASLTPMEAAILSAEFVTSLTGPQFAALTPDAIAALSAQQLVGVRPGAVNRLSAQQLDALDVAGLSTFTIGGLAEATLNGFTASQLGDFSPAQVLALTTAQVAGLSIASLDALNPNYFGPAQVAGLPAAYVRKLPVGLFDESLAGQVAYLSLTGVKGLSIAQIESMTVAENSTISLPQFEALNAVQQQAVLAGGAWIALAKSLEVNGLLNYSNMLQFLETAAVGGMNPVKFGALRLLASELNASGGIATSAWVENITQDVIEGNSANAYWNGGSSTAEELGDLTVSSSQAQMDELISKWFLGADLPSLSLPASIGYPVPSEYQAVNLPLFGAEGPSYLDVNQGNVGDGYFLAALAETAYLDPAFIENMIHERSNGTYYVCFQVNGESDYVTVNDELPVMLDNYEAANGSTLEFANSTYAWAPMIEKAYAQLVEQTGVTAGSLLGVNGDAYADLAGGGGNGISVITGQDTDWDGLTAGESAGDLANLAAALQADVSAHRDVLFASSSLQDGIGQLVNDQMFEVLAVNAAQQLVLLQNPWNGSGIGSGKQMQFWESLSGLAMDSDGLGDPSGFYVARGESSS